MVQGDITKTGIKQQGKTSIMVGWAENSSVNRFQALDKGGRKGEETRLFAEPGMSWV